MSSHSQSEQNQYIVALKKSATKIKELLDENAKLKQKSPIAVIGMACRFPGGANNPELFWTNLQDGIDSVIEIPSSRWNTDVYFDPNPEADGKTYNKYSGLITGHDLFDNKFFEISPLEAQEMDPQQRILLEVSYEAFENAGINIEDIRGSKTGTYIGIHTNDHLRLEEAYGLHQRMSPYSLLGNAFSISCGRLNYFYDLHGPSVPTDTACSSTITALHGAISALNNKEIDMAIVGGVNMLMTPGGYIGLCKLKSLSKSSHCKAFDDEADGFVRGEGCGIIVLKRLNEAIANKDNILGVIKGLAVGQDGKSNGIAAPNGLAQEQIIKNAMDAAGVSPEDIDWVETHGTGTPLGDPIEVGALTNIFKERKNKLYIGSVKTNLGHLESAAGAASIIKVLLSLNKNVIPASLHFKKPNTLIPWDEISIGVAKNNIVYPKNNKKRVVGINSFGYNGSISHTIIEEAPEFSADNAKILPNSIFTLSAKNKSSLTETLKKYIEYLPNTTDKVHDICYTSNISRTAFNQKIAVTAKSNEDLVKKLKLVLENPERAELVTSSEDQLNKKLVFMFTGQGSQYFKMADEFYKLFPVFKNELEICNKIASNYIDQSIIDILYNENFKEHISQAKYAQPVIFSIEYSLAKLLISLGIKPALLIGHSIGEYAAACISGVFSLEDAIKIVCQRGKLMQNVTPKGKMAGILTSEEKALELMKGIDNISIAAINAPSNVTVSGTEEAVEEFLKRIKGNKIFIEKLDITHAFHSVVMEPYRDPFFQEIKEIKYNAPQIPIIADLTGKVVKGEVLNAEYWSKHLYNSIQFQKSIDESTNLGYNLYLEIGGTATLSGLAGQCITNSEARFFPMLRKDKEVLQQFNESIAQLYLAGVYIDWKKFHQSFGHRKVILPNYVFNWKRYSSGPYPDNPHNLMVIPNTQQLAAESISAMTEGVKSVKPLTYVRITGSKPSLDELLSEIKEMISQVSGFGYDEIEDNLNLFSLGLDSLMLVQFIRKIELKYEVEISMNDFLTELNTLNKISGYIHKKMPEKPVSNNTNPVNTMSAFELTQSGDMDIKQLFTRQLQIIEKQIEALKTYEEQSVTKVVQKKRKEHKSQAGIGNNRGIVIEEDKLSPQQKLFLLEFINNYIQLTSKSKEYAQKYRNVMADWINSLNFRPTLKEILYPIVPAKMQGAKFIDIDGNEYIDIGMGRGANFLGHNPEFVSKAIEEQVKNGYGIGSQNYLAGEVASLISELTHCDRVTFSNTGTEAVMAAIRIARTKSGKNIIVKFAGAYHGTFDGIMVEGDEMNVYPISPGTPQGMVDQVMVLNYGSNESLEIIEKYATELAAVIVEPVQSRNPSLQPKEFLVKLRKLTEDKGIILIFDEMITGFRIHPGGAQAFFNIQADMCTYGKIPGGGMPIGIITGKAKYMDAIDAGFWQYGDSSVPPSGTTVFGGTFCKHPFAMAAAHASMLYMKEKGASLQEGVNEKMKYFADAVNEFFTIEKVPVKIHYFGSQFRFISTGKYDLSLQPLEMEIFFNLLMSKGVYTWERRICHLSIDHTYNDLNYIIKAIKETVAEIRKAGFSFHIEDLPGQLPDQICYPLSSHQLRTFTLCQFPEAEQAYHITKALILEGELDIDRLQYAFNKLVQNHQSLRTGFKLINDQIIQIVHKQVDFKVEEIQAKNKSKEDLFRAFTKSFNLESPPLIRIGLCKLSAKTYFLILDAHHIVVDGYSLNIMIPELVCLYNGDIDDSSSSDYISFVNWENNYRTTEKYLAQKDYWVNKLQGDLPECELPLDYSRSKLQDYSGKTVYMKIGAEKTSKVKTLAKKYALTDFMFLLGSFKLLVYKLTGLEDIVIGTPVLIRPGSKYEHSIGMFTNNMVLRTYPKCDKTLLDYFTEIKADCLSSFANMEFPFNDLVNNLQLPRDANRNPLYSIMFVYEKADDRIINFNNVTTSELDIANNNSLTDITFEIIEANNVLNVSVNFANKLYKQSTIEHWNDFFLRIVDQLIEVSENDQFTNQTLSEINLLDEKEKKKILYEFNPGKTPIPNNTRVIDLFIQQAGKTPDNTALVFGNKKMSYRELNEKSNQLARTLQKNGVKPNSVVGMMINRSFEMIIGIFGIQKAGGAYLPIDPEYPDDRKLFMLKDSLSKVLLTSSILNADFGYEGDVILLDDDKAYSDNVNNLTVTNAPSDLAYIIYTSGTTGKPKGVMIEHYSLLNRLLWMQKAYPITNKDAILFKTTYVFDVSVWEIFWWSFIGARLCILKSKSERDPSEIVSAINSYKINTMHFVPSMLSVFLDYVSENKAQNSLTTLKQIFTSGEALQNAHESNFKKLLNKTSLINLYGPTEATVDVSFFTCLGNNFEKSVPIGKPIDNISLYIVNSSFNIQPVGIAGELLIEGVGLARGYINRDGLTKEKFIYWEPETGKTFDKNNKPESAIRVYRTGDLCRWLPDGNIEFIGRIDHQEKIRGFRIELGEIENQLLNLEGIKEAIVIPKEDAFGQKNLVAYFVSSEQIDITELRLKLSMQLPDYMIPAYFMQLEKLPLNSNGKINRKALPEPQIVVKEYIAPRDVQEEKLVEIWSEILTIDKAKISINANFFELGGHSLKATILASKIHKTFDANISLADIFKMPTISLLSHYISDAKHFLHKVDLSENIEIERISL